MNTKEVRAWFSTGGGTLAGFNLTYNQREVVVAKIMRAYAAGAFDGARAERKRSRELAAKHEKARFEASPPDVLFPTSETAAAFRIPANAARDKIRKSIDDMARGDEEED